MIDPCPDHAGHGHGQREDRRGGRAPTEIGRQHDDVVDRKGQAGQHDRRPTPASAAATARRGTTANNILPRSEWTSRVEDRHAGEAGRAGHAETGHAGGNRLAGRSQQAGRPEPGVIAKQIAAKTSGAEEPVPRRRRPCRAGENGSAAAGTRTPRAGERRIAATCPRRRPSAAPRADGRPGPRNTATSPASGRSSPEQHAPISARRNGATAAWNLIGTRRARAT